MKVKICGGCKQEKPLSEFYNNKSKKDGKQSCCKLCTNKAVNNHYTNNKKYYKDKRGKRAYGIREWVRELKSTLACTACGENHPATLDFHHRNPQEKDLEISKMSTYGWSVERMQKEIDKCDVLCSNCHRKLHHDLARIA